MNMEGVKGIVENVTAAPLDLAQRKDLQKVHMRQLNRLSWAITPWVSLGMVILFIALFFFGK